MTYDIRIAVLPSAGRHYRGIKARRQAFAVRQRRARMLRRVADLVDTLHFQECLKAFEDALVYGTGLMRIARVEPMPYLVKRVTREEFETEYATAWPPRSDDPST